MVLSASPENLGQTLATMARSIGAKSACLISWTEHEELAVLSGWGDSHKVEERPRVRQLFTSATELGSNDRVILSNVFGERPSTAVAATCSPTSETIGLVVDGELPDSRATCALLELILKVLTHDTGQQTGFRADLRDQATKSLTFPDAYVVGQAPATERFHTQLSRVANSGLPVLLLGETGVGKELAARTLHLSSQRADGPFVAVNCAAIPEELLEAELFGVEAGVASGVSARAGKLVLANNGTVFLDEIADTPLSIQAKLLRVLQEKKVEALGARASTNLDLRLVAATNSDLMDRVGKGTFRADLYYRIAGVTVRIPPLRQRREDIPLLVESFLRSIPDQKKLANTGMTVAALRALMVASWPGNIRELAHACQYLLHNCPPGRPIDSTMLPEDLPTHARKASPISNSATGRLARQVEDLERGLITEALERSKGNRSQAAKDLGLSRNGLLKKIRRYQLGS